jgi:hypothetical protein
VVQVRREATAGQGEELLALLIERSTELKRGLADFACSDKEFIARVRVAGPYLSLPENALVQAADEKE